MELCEDFMIKNGRLIYKNKEAHHNVVKNDNDNYKYQQKIDFNKETKEKESFTEKENLYDKKNNNNNNNDNSSDNSTITCPLRDAENSLTQSAILYTELTRRDIEKIIKMKPIDIKKYRKAFVHKSVVKTAREDENLPDYMEASYERYEFLGDSVLSLIVAKYIFAKFPNCQEGNLTKIRTKLVNGKTLSLFANKLELSKFLILNYKVENINGRTNNRILEDVFESLICAIYLDLGFNYAEKFVIDLIEEHIDFDELLIDNNYKDILLRFCQNKFGTTPSYKLLETNGPPHNRTFKILCYIQDIEYKYGRGKNKKEAEQIAALETLKYFKVVTD
jgi:ribonuclease-3